MSSDWVLASLPSSRVVLLTCFTASCASYTWTQTSRNSKNRCFAQTYLAIILWNFIYQREAGCLKLLPLTQGKLLLLVMARKKNMEKAVTIKLTKAEMNCFILVHCVYIHWSASLKSTDPALLICTSLCETAFRPWRPPGTLKSTESVFYCLLVTINVMLLSSW